MSKNLLAALLGIVSISGISHAAILIDDFTQVQNLSQTGPGPASDLITPATGAIGNARELLLNVDVAPSGGATVGVNGIMNYSNDANVDSDLEVIWFGGNVAPSITPFDITQGGLNTGIRLAFTSDSPIPYVLRLYTSAADYLEFNGNTPDTNNNPANLDLLFLNGTPSSGLFNITQIAGVSLFLNPGVSGDLTLDFIEARDLTNVPEPMSLSLVGGALLAAGVFGRRRMARR